VSERAFQLERGDCLEVLRRVPDSTFDAVVTDPPYGIGFFGNAWDHEVPGPEVWREVLRVAKPGAHLLAFGGTRKFHRLACALEDAGWVLRDTLCWLHGQGFPKGVDVGVSIDKRRDDRARVLEVTSFVREAVHAAGLSGAEVDELLGYRGMTGHWMSAKEQPAVPNPGQWAALKSLLNFGDACDALVAELNSRKGKASDEHLAAPVLFRHGQAAPGATWRGRPEPLDDGVRAATSEEGARWRGYHSALKPAWEPILLALKRPEGTLGKNAVEHGVAGLNVDANRLDASDGYTGRRVQKTPSTNPTSWDPNAGPRPSSRTSSGRWPANLLLDGESAEQLDEQAGELAEGGSASRFFYVAKPDGEERDGNRHPTVKPADLMAWLCRLVTMPGGSLMLDPFTGSGSTGVGCLRVGSRFFGIEREERWVDTSRRRILADAPLFNLERELVKLAEALP
jgi:hypothetical protein